MGYTSPIWAGAGITLLGLAVMAVAAAKAPAATDAPADSVASTTNAPADSVGSEPNAPALPAVR
jgi:DHA1 family inner membrane transport protein